MPIHTEGQLIGGVIESRVVAVVNQTRPFYIQRCAATEVELRAEPEGQPRIIGVEVGVVAVNLRAGHSADCVAREPWGNGQDAFDIAAVQGIEVGMKAIGPATADGSTNATFDRQIRIELLANAEDRHRGRQLGDALFVVEDLAGAGAEIEAAITGAGAVVVTRGHDAGGYQRRYTDSDPSQSLVHYVLPGPQTRHRCARYILL